MLVKKPLNFFAIFVLMVTQINHSYSMSEAFTKRKSHHISNEQYQQINQMLLNILKNNSVSSILKTFPDVIGNQQTAVDSQKPQGCDHIEQKQIAEKLAFVVALVHQTLVNENGNIEHALIQRLILESLEQIDLPEDFKPIVKELMTKLLYSYFDEQGNIVTDGPEFDQRNEAAAFTLIQFLKKNFPNQSNELLETLASPLLKEVMAHANEKDWVKKRETFTRPNRQEAANDSWARKPHSRITKIKRNLESNRTKTNMFLELTKAYNQDPEGGDIVVSITTLEIMKARLLMIAMQTCPGLIHSANNNKRYTPQPAIPHCLLIKKMIDQINKLLDKKELPLKEIVMDILNEIDEQMALLKNSVQSINTQKVYVTEPGNLSNSERTA